ncbi:MAG: ABC transporter ATP-binding protein [Actinomycetes bacterium]
MNHEFRRLVALTRPYAGRMVAVTLAGFAGIGCGLAVPLVVRHLVNSVLVDGHKSELLPLIGLVALLAIARGIANWFRRNAAGMVSVLVETDLRDRLFGHVQGLPVSFHDEWETGQLLARATSDLMVIREFLAFGLTFLLLVSGIIVGVVGTLLWLDVWLGLAILCMAPLLGFAAARFTNLVRPYVMSGRDQLGDVAAIVEQSAGGIRVLKAFGREDRQIRALADRATLLMDTDLDAVRVRSIYVPMLALIPNLMLAATLGIGGWQVINGNLDVGAIVASYQLLAMMTFLLRNIGWILAMVQQGTAANTRVQEILTTDPTITDAPHAKQAARVDGRIEFDHVSVRFPGSSSPALDDITLTIEPGEVVALAGPSGSGKSVLASLLSRFRDPEAGEVRLDGHPLPSITLHSLRSQVGVVFDEPVLFSASVLENIAFGEPSASADDIMNAAHAAGVDDVANVLPAGYETRVGEQGYGLSGGQRQRIALARALVKKPRVLVLDDPLSAVDARTEATIEASLAPIMRGRTVVLIAQRASTLAMADRIVLMEQGRIVAEGSHLELIATEPRYARLLGEADEADEHVRRTTATVDDVAGVLQ